MDKKVMAIMACSWLTPDQLRGLTPAQLRGLAPAQLSWLTPAQLSWLTPDQLRGLTPDQLSWLTPAQLSWLTPAQLRGLTPDQLSWLTPDQLRGLTPAQLRGLAPAQLSWLTPEDVPVVTSLYTQMLEAIRAEQRVLKQSTFGPEVNPGPNVCNTPMCVGGHTVHIAGAAGYKLASKVGFSIAASLIHNASRPGVAPPRYDVYPDEWALAYIEERAAEEAVAA